jgi:cobalamin biosynthetic protein CobC
MGGEGIWHGGDLDEARALFPGAPEPWVDLSTGINPVPYPLPALPSRLFERLPAPADHAALEQAAAAAYGVADPATVVAAPGTQILISLLPRLAPPGPVAVLGPTYAEHARAWSLAGHDVREVRSPTEARGAAVLVVVNPNNPDGRALPRDALLDLAGFMDRRGGRLVVDEAFADFDDAQALAPVRPRGAVVLRSFGKTYGLAGIRLGFAVADIGVAASLRGALGPWAASGPAIEIGRLALRDRTWLARARGGAGRGRAPPRRAPRSVRRHRGHHPLPPRGDGARPGPPRPSRPRGSGPAASSTIPPACDSACPGSRGVGTAGAGAGGIRVRWAAAPWVLRALGSRAASRFEARAPT